MYFAGYWREKKPLAPRLSMAVFARAISRNVPSDGYYTLKGREAI